MRSISIGLPRALLGLLLFAFPASSQQVTVSTPYQSLNDSFFENMGTSWGLSGPNWNFSFGGSPMQAAPHFGGFDPSAGANFGFGGGSGGVGGYFGGTWSQGNRRSFTSQTPSVTLQNGMPGGIFDTSQSPFVISYVPVVGGFPTVGALTPVQPMPPGMAATPGASGTGRDAVVNALGQDRAQRRLQERLAGATAAEAEVARREAPDDLVLGGSPPSRSEPAPGAAVAHDEPTRKLAAARASSAGRPAPSVAEARRLHAAEQAKQDAEAEVYVELGRNAEAKGKPSVAKVYYQMAARRASGALRDQVLTRLDALKASPNAP